MLVIAITRRAWKLHTTWAVIPENVTSPSQVGLHVQSGYVTVLPRAETIPQGEPLEVGHASSLGIREAAEAVAIRDSTMANCILATCGIVN